MPADGGPSPGASAPGTFPPEFRSAALERAGIKPISFAMPKPDPGLPGCTGVSRVGACICCDRLYATGPQITPKAKRGADNVYRCPNQVVDGVHAGSVRQAAGVEPSLQVGG